MSLFFAFSFASAWAVLEPTIHSTSAWGNWNSVSTWVEGVVPDVDDVVEVNWLVNIVWNTTVGGVSITWNGILRKTESTYNYYTLIVNGDVENNGIIWWYNNNAAKLFYVHFKWDVINNGSLNYVSQVHLYWDLTNGSGSSWLWNTYIQDTETNGVRTITSSENFKPNLYLNWDVELLWDIDFQFTTYLQNHTLYVDGTKNIYLNYPYVWKILSSNTNWDGESIKVWNIYNVETNIENTEILYNLNGFTWKKVSSKWNIVNTSTFDTLTLNGLSKITWNTTLNWDVIITWSGILRKTESTYNYYTLTVNGDVENNGVIWWYNNNAAKLFYVHFKWDIINNGSLSYVSQAHLYWDVTNGSGSSWLWNTYIQDTETNGVRTITSSENFKPNLYLNWDVELLWDIDFQFTTYLQNYTLFVDGTKNIYLNYPYVWKILSSNGNWDGETIKVWSIYNVETNMENTEVWLNLNWFTWRDVTAKWNIVNTSIFDRLTLDGASIITWNTILNWDVIITWSGILRKTESTYNYYTLTVDGGIENNGIIWWYNNNAAKLFYVHFKWNVVNNGSLSYISQAYLYWDVTNWVDSSWSWNTYIQDTETDGVRTITSSPNFKPNLYLSWDVELLWDIDFQFTTYLQNHTLYVDGTRNIYLNYPYVWKVLSSNTNWDGEAIKVWSIYNVETNIENIEVWSNLNGFTWRKVLAKWNIVNTSTFDILALDGLSKITWNTLLNWDVVVTWSGILRKTESTYNYYTLTVNGNVENNGIIWWYNNNAAKLFYIHFKWDVLNNGSLSYISQAYLYWDVTNGSDSWWSWNTYIQDTETDGVRTITSSDNFKPNLYLNWDVELLWDINFQFTTYLQNYTLYVDGAKDIYLNYPYVWKILSSNINWDGEIIKVWSIYNTETNIENTEVLYNLNGFTWRKVLAKWNIVNTSTFDRLTLDGTSIIMWNTILNWDVVLTWNGILRKTELTYNYYTLTVDGGIENNGIIWWYNNNAAKLFYVHFKWDVINNGSLSYVSQAYLYGALDNINGNISTNTYLKWAPIDSYSDYILSITWEEDISVNNSTQYLLPTAIKETWTNLYWRVKWDGILSDSDWTEAKCINVPWCIQWIWLDQVAPLIGSLTSTQTSITLINQEFINFKIAWIKDLDADQTLTFSYSLDGTNYINFSSTWSTPMENWEFNFNLDLSNLEDGAVVIYAKVNDGIADSNIATLTLNKNTLPDPITINWDLLIANQEEYNLLNGANITVEGNVVNNWTILTSSGWTSKITAKWNIENNWSFDVTQLYVNGTQARTINWSTPISSDMNLQSNITIDGDFVYDGVIYLNGYTLYVDGTKQISLWWISWHGAIVSSNWEWSWESITIKTITQDTAPIVIEIENLEVTQSITTQTIGDTTVNKVVVKTVNLAPSTPSNTGGGWPAVITQTVSGNIQADIVIISSNYEIDITTTTISWDVIVDQTIENVDATVIEEIVQQVEQVSTWWDVLNIDYKQWYTYLIWDSIENAVSYNFYLKDDSAIQVVERYYELEIASLPTGTYNWYVRWVYADGNLSDATTTYQVNVINENFTPDFSYSNYVENNGNIFVQNNIPSWEEIFIWPIQETSTQSTNNTVSQEINTEATAWDPVNLNTWEFVYDNTLMQYKSVWFPFEFKINYQNQSYYNGPLWNNFDYNYNQFLVEDNDGNINYHNGKLGVFQFIKSWTWFLGNETLKWTLSLANGTYSVNLNNTTTLSFNNNLRLQSITDNFSNTMSFMYDANNALTQIIDTNSRVYNLTYYGHSRIKDITDFNGDTVEFIYFWTGETDGDEFDLKTITTTNTISSKEISFTYTMWDTFESSHNILQLIDSENNIYVENTYNGDDRVATQKFWEGTIWYTYTLDAENQITQNSVLDREGNNVIYTYDSNWNTIGKIVKKYTWDSIYTYEYDNNNYISKEILPLWNGYTYDYDTRSNLIEKRMKQDVQSADSAEDIVYSYTYHPVFNKITQAIAPNGRVTNFELDSNGNITKTEVLWVQDYDGNTIIVIEEFEYNTLWELIKKIDGNGSETSFEYQNGNLLKTVKSLSWEEIATNYSYDNKWNITSITDAEWNISNLSYDDFNMLKKLTTPEGIVSEYVYNKLNKKTNEKIILSGTETIDSSYEYDILDNPTKITTDIDASRQKITVTQYDKNSNITEITDGNNATQKFEYNEAWFIIKKTVIPTEAGINQNIITKYVYDINNRLITQIHPNETQTKFEYDLFDRIEKQIDPHFTTTQLEYDALWGITEARVSDGNNTLVLKEQNTFDILWRVIENKKILLAINETITTKTKYDAIWNIIETVDPKGNSTLYGYDTLNRLTTATDTLGNIITHSYNKNDKITEKKIVWTTGKTIGTSYEYDTDSRLIKEIDNNGDFEGYAYNKLNQVITKTDKDGWITHYTYDYSWNILSESHEWRTINYSYDINWNLEKVTDANDNITLYDYNDLWQLVTITYPDQQVMRYEYDISWNLNKTTDPNGTVVVNNYDRLNRLKQRDIQTWVWVWWVTSEIYEYDALWRLISATDNEWNDLWFEYDSLWRLVNETNSDKTITYTHDISWNRTSITSPQPSPAGEGVEAISTNYTYDGANRWTSITRNDQNIANYTYDSFTQLSKTLWNWVVTNYSYDALSRLSSLWNYNYTYNTQWNIVSNGVDSYSYDTQDRITTTNYQTKHKNKSSESFEYDLMWNRSREILTKLTKNGTQREKKFAYATNNLNQYLDRSIYVDIEEIEEETSTGTIETPTGTGTIEIISTEIITEAEFIEEESDAIEESLEETEEIELEWRLIYDNNGNLIWNNLNNKRQYIYSYDYKNRLIKVEKNIYKKVNDIETEEIEQIKRIVEISYDVLWRRIEKKLNNGSYRKYYYSNQDIIWEENYSKKDKLKNSKEFIYWNSIDDIISMNIIAYKTRKIEEEYINANGKAKTRKIKESYVETNTYYYQKDHLWSIIAITDETGSIVEEYAYDVFWKPYTKEENGKITRLKKSKIWNTRLYTGREYDRGLKLYYNRARYYNPQLGRFISRDPIDISDDVNLYAYVGGNPVGFVDRMGLAAKAFVKAYDDYLEIKSKIYNFWWGKDLWFLFLNSYKKQQLTNEFNRKQKLARDLHYNRNDFNTLNQSYELKNLDKDKWNQLSYWKALYHQQTAPLHVPNKKFVSFDWHQEVVYTHRGYLETDDEDIWTYNFFSPVDEPILHSKYDISPYYEWWNSYNDNTSLLWRKTWF